MPKPTKAPKTRPRASVRPPKKKASEAALKALEQKMEARERGNGADVQLRSTATARQGTLTEPYVRRDGESTRAATIHFLAELHDKLRLSAVQERLPISRIVNMAVENYYADQA